MGSEWLDAMNIEDRYDGHEEDDMVMRKTVTKEVDVDPRIEDLVRFALYLSTELGGTSIRDLTQENLIGLAERFWEAQHGED